FRPHERITRSRSVRATWCGRSFFSPCGTRSWADLRGREHGGGEDTYALRVLSVVPTPITVRVPAKVNLHLSVGDVRPDGYHELVTVFQALSLVDEVTVVTSDEPGIEVRGEGADWVPTGPSNLAWKAVQLLAEYSGRDPEEPGVRLSIQKGIPVAGGMAG